jgi:Putative prokaryotic signal transducing protein
MSRSPSTSHKRGSHHSGAHSGGGAHDGGHDEGGGGGGGGGKLIKVGFARNQAEAELLQGLLLESDIPSILKRSGGFDNPDFLAAGPHDIWVNAGHGQKAREILAETMTEDEGEAEERAEMEGEARLRRGGPATETSPQRLALWLGVAVLGAVILVWVLYQLT